MPKRIKSLKPRAVALVKNPATRIHFYVIRSEQVFEELKSLAEEWMGKDNYVKLTNAIRAAEDVEDEEDEDEDEEKKKGNEAKLSEEISSKIKAALEVFRSWKNDLPDDVIVAVGTLAALVGEPEITGHEKKSEDVGVRQMIEDKDFMDAVSKAVHERIMPKIKEELTAEVESGFAQFAEAMNKKG